MKINVEIDCSAEEARHFLGLPDVTTLNAFMVDEMKKRIDANMTMLQPDEVLKAWSAFGGQAQEQFRKLMTSAADAALSGRNRS